jgi:hypothetical protein
MRTALALIVTPFSRSRSMESRSCSRISRSVTVWVICIRRSASVLLPWSMWAMIEKLRIWTTTDADGNGFDSPEGEANPFLSASVVVSAGMATPSPVDPGRHEILLQVAANLFFQRGHTGVDGAAERSKGQDARCNEGEVVVAAECAGIDDLVHARAKGHGEEQRRGQRAAQFRAVAEKLVHVLAEDHPGPAPEFGGGPAGAAGGLAGRWRAAQFCRYGHRSVCILIALSLAEPGAKYNCCHPWQGEVEYHHSLRYE